MGFCPHSHFQQQTLAERQFWIDFLEYELNSCSFSDPAQVNKSCLISEWNRGRSAFGLWDFPRVRRFRRDLFENNQKCFTLIAQSHLFFHSDLRTGTRGARLLTERFGVCSRWSAVSMTDSSCPTRGARRVGCFGTENPHHALLQWE